MDEVGRGTGTNDGLSIAWAVSEELLNRIKCRTFFATHYHELSLLSHSGIVNRSMEVREKDGGIIFLRRLKEGPTAESYGIHVARLAGLSPAVLHRAGQIMDKLRERDVNLKETLPSVLSNDKLINVELNNDELNNDELTGHNTEKTTNVNQKNDTVNTVKETVMPPAIAAFLRELHFLDPDKMTPLEALGLINEWKQRFAGRGGGVGAIPVSDHINAKPRDNKANNATPSLFD
jgi:DNA mismatch repair protein MutS